MINLLLFLFFVTCISFAAVLLVENPGNITMVWFDYQIETSVAFILFIIIFIAIFIALFTLLIRNIVFAPARFLQRRNVGQLKSGISELTYGIAALASSNIDAASSHVRKVEKLLGKTPLTLLLSAQIAKMRGDEVETQVLLSQLLEYKETEYLAMRSLSDNAVKHDNLPKALQLAKKAQEVNPKDNASALAVVSLQVRLKYWHEALITLQNSRLQRREKLRIRALIQLARGKLLLDDGRDEVALVLARNIISVLPDFAPAVVFTARVYNENNMSRKAIRLLIKAWKNDHNILFVEAMNEITSHEPVERQKKLRSLLFGDVHDGAWLCKICDNNQRVWELHCDSCRGFDSLEWK